MNIKKWRKAVRKKFEKIFKPVNREPYLRAIRLYFNDYTYNVLHTITDVEVSKTKKETTITITTHRPGLVIGRMGKTIDGLQKYISKQTGENIEILLIESRLWFRGTK